MYIGRIESEMAQTVKSQARRLPAKPDEDVFAYVCIFAFVGEYV